MDMPHKQIWHLAHGATAKAVGNKSVIVENDGAKALFVWDSDKISIEKDKILESEMSDSIKQISPTISVEFKTPDEKSVENAPAIINTLILDITDSPEKLNIELLESTINTSPIKTKYDMYKAIKRAKDILLGE